MTEILKILRLSGILITHIINLLIPSLCLAQAQAQAQDISSPPLKLNITNIFDINHNIRGGLSQETALLYNLDITAELNSEFFGWKEGTFFIYGLVNNAKEFKPLVGDFQGTSNIDNGEVFRLYEFWYEHRFSNAKASLKIGLFDLNSEFDAIEPAGLFLNSSHGIGPEISQTGLNGPSIFPSTSLALRLQYSFNDNFLVRTAILDAVPNDPDHPESHKISLNEGALLIGEVEMSPSTNWRTVIGLWHYTRKFNHIDSTIVGKIGGNSGIYAFADARITDKISVWARVGKSNQKINQLSHYIGSGIVYKGLLPSRFNDSLGFSIAAAGNGGSFKKLSARNLSPVEDYEVTYELTYQFSITPWLSLQPDLQYIYHPGMDPTLKNALVAGIRVEINTGY